MNTKLLVLLCCSARRLSACHKSAPEEAAGAAEKPTGAAHSAESKDKDKEAGEGVSLTPEQIEKIGLQTEALKTVDYAEETAGYGTVIPHEAIAQAVAELSTAQAAEKQSRSALARTQRLSGTPGAMSADVEEANARQLAVDTAALNLAKQRLSASFGQKPPWSGGENPALLQALADGSKQLVRVTFPLGALPGDGAKNVERIALGFGCERQALEVDVDLGRARGRHRARAQLLFGTACRRAGRGRKNHRVGADRRPAARRAGSGRGGGHQRGQVLVLRRGKARHVRPNRDRQRQAL